METVLILVLLMMNYDERTRESLKNFLNFYRENRELIAAIAGRPAPSPNSDSAEVTQGTEHKAEQKESRPEREVGNQAILEEYLKRFTS